MSFKIIGDSCTDPVPGLKDAPEYAMVPLIIRIGNQEYVDNGMLTTEDLVARMAASPEGTGTACPAPQWYMDAFEGAERFLQQRSPGQRYLLGRASGEKDPCV